MTDQQTIEFEAETLDEARKRLKTRKPKGFVLISERVISDGTPQTVKASADTIEEATIEARNKIPNGAEVLETKELESASKETLIVEAFDEQIARIAARSKGLELFGRVGDIVKIRMVSAGRKGLLGVGKQPNQYEVEIHQRAEVSLTYKTKAKIRAQFQSKESHLRQSVERLEMQLAAVKKQWERELLIVRQNFTKPGQNADSFAFVSEQKEKIEKELASVRKQLEEMAPESAASLMPMEDGQGISKSVSRVVLIGSKAEMSAPDFSAPLQKIVDTYVLHKKVPANAIRFFVHPELTLPDIKNQGMCNMFILAGFMANGIDQPKSMSWNADLYKEGDYYFVAFDIKL